MERDDKALIQDEDSWPGETLCLKKLPTKPGETAGVMGYSAFGVLTNSCLPLQVLLWPNFNVVMQYDTVDAMLADGWIVD